MATTQLQSTSTSKDSDFPVSPDPRKLWHASAPTTLVKAYKEADTTGRWQVWTDYLADRQGVEPLADRISGRGPQLAWSLPAGLERRDTADLIVRLAKLGKGKRGGADSIGEELPCWLAEADGALAEPGYALESLAWCHALPALARALDEPLWWELFDHVCQTASAATAIDDAIDVAGEPLAAQLLAGELASTLGYLFPEMKRCRRLSTTGRNALSVGLTELLDGEGIIEGKHLDVLRPLLACWTRCFYIGRDQKGGPFKRDAQVQYEWFVRTALRLTRADGTQTLTSGAPSVWCKELFEAALEAGGDDSDEEVAEVILPGKKRAKSANDEDWCTPEAAAHSEWAELSVLRPQWSRNGPRLTIAYGGETMRAELEVGGEVLFSGPWTSEVIFDGKLLSPTCDWEEVCWMSDEDADYIELEIELTEGYRVQRQILIAREDDCLFVADVVLGERSGRLEYRTTLPLVEGCRFEPAEEHRDGFLVGKKRRALVLPLALPEWRSDRRIGELTTTETGLQLSQTAEAARTYAPLFFDLHPRRLTKPSTWRQLTVADQREIVPRDVAAGYRVQVADEQWLFYRSLAERGNRTLLGHNLNGEFLAAWFHETGEVEAMVEIGEP